MTPKNKVLIGLVIAALISRIAPHYPNFTAMGALAFMGRSLAATRGISVDFFS